MKLIVIIAMVFIISSVFGYSFEYSYDYYDSYVDASNSSMGDFVHKVYKYNSFDPETMLYNVVKPWAFTDNVIITMKSLEIAPGNDMPLTDRVKVKFGDNGDWSSWQEFTSENEIKIFTHDFGTLNSGFQDEVIHVKAVFTTINGVSDEYDYSFTMRIFPSVDKKVVNSYGDELLIYQSNQTIGKPILLIEGFDPLNTTGSLDYYKLSPDWFYDDLIDAGYDVYMLIFF